MITTRTQAANPQRHIFEWPPYRGSIRVTDEGKTIGGWGRITVSGSELQGLAQAILGAPDRVGYPTTSGNTWYTATPYQLAQLLFKAGQIMRGDR